MTNDETRDDLAAAIRAALAGTTEGEWQNSFSDEGHFVITADREIVAIVGNVEGLGPNQAANAEMFAAAPGLLREAAARIDADAARIAKLTEQIAVLERETDTTLCDECHGIGTVSRPFRGEYVQTIVCPKCAGRGTVPNDE
jgi:transposase